MKIDNGRYICVATEHSILPEGTKKDGTYKAPAVNVTLRVIDGPLAGKEIYWYGSLHDNAQEFTARTLHDMGWSCNDITALTGLGTLKVNVVGSEDTYMGKPQQRWGVFPIRTLAPRLADDNKSSFADRFKALGVSTPVVTVSEQNIAPKELPTPLNRTGMDVTTDGPIGSTPF